MVPREQAFQVYWKGEGEVPGLLLYGLRRPDEQPRADLALPAGARASEPYELHGDGWAVDLWTIRADSGLPAGEAWQALLRGLLGRLLEAGYQAAWLALEGDFADPPHLFDPDLMGESVYAAATPETGFMTHDDGDGELETLTDAELERLRALATTVWPGAEAEL
jgi:hypothetical protein